MPVSVPRAPWYLWICTDNKFRGGVSVPHPFTMKNGD